MLENRNSKLEPRNSILDSQKLRESSFESRLSTYLWAVLYKVHQVLHLSGEHKWSARQRDVPHLLCQGSVTLDMKKCLQNGNRQCRLLHTVIPHWCRAPCTNLNPILRFTCKIYLTVSSREVLSMSANDSAKVVTPNSFLRLRKVLSETRRFLAMAAQRNPAPLRSTSNKSSEISSLGRPGTPDLTTPTLAVESCCSSSACKAK